MTDKATQKRDFSKDSPDQVLKLMQSSYERMLTAQSNFSNLAVSRALEIAADSGLNMSDSHVMGVSFAPGFAIVQVIYKPVILTGPEDTGEPRQIQIPVPAECLFPIDESWKIIYAQKLEESQEAVKKDKESGEISKALNGEVGQ